ncbi:MAG: protein kinase domain-containing protein [Pyrinomonadaceae bacterium]
MANNGWEKAKRIFGDAIKIAPAERVRFLDEHCAGDADTRREVESLLASFDDAESFMEKPAVGEVAEVMRQNANLESGKTFGHYEIVKQIGAGGMGEVYLAKDKRLDRRVAVKILNEQFSRHESNLQRFVKEAKAASALNHPNILVIHEIGESEEAHYIISEYIEGETLRERFGNPPMKLFEVLDIAIQISNALSAAHTAHIVHRDIKPENIIVRPDGYVKILDFGLAKLVEQKVVGLEASTVKQNETAKGIILGTVNYMSPEQAKGERIDERTDIFSFGVLLYEMIAGRTPFAAGTMSETFANLINSEPQPLARYAANVPEELQRVISKMLRKKKDERYQTMREVLTDLKSLQKRLEFETEFGKFGVPSLGGGRNQQDTKILESSTTTKPTKIGIPNTNSIAVLPFANMSNDAENEYFCDGLAEELLNALAKIKNLNVAARTSAFSFKGKNTNVGDIGEILNVKTILEGSVRKAGNRLRISIQLVNASNGYHIWSKRYDGEMKDIFDLQDEITLAVIDELKVKFLSEEKAALLNRYAENVEAYQLYLKGRYHFLKLTPAEIEKGISYFHQAIAIDPNYALAYAGLAAAYVTFPMTCDLPSEEFFPKAKAAAHKAIEIDDSLSETYSALFWATFWYDWDWSECERQCLRAIELNPKSGDAHESYAHLLSNVGRHDEALAEIKRARELDPLHLRINALEGQFLLHAGKPDEAIEPLQKTLELVPQFWLAHLFLSCVYIEKGMFAEAVESAEKARQFSGISTHPIAFGGYALAKSGREKEARALLKELLNLSAERYVPSSNIAMIYNGLGETENALEYLERAFAERDARMAFLKVEPKWNSLRREPRFIELMRRVNFPADETTPDESGSTASKAKATDANTASGDERLNIPVKTANRLAAHQTSESFFSGIAKNRKQIFIGGLIVFLLAAISFGYYFWSAKKTISDAGGRKSLAVLPFINASQDPNAEYLSDGITESIINNLSQLSGVKVMSRNSSFRFKNNQTDAKNIAAQLGVETLVTGDIKQLGDKLIINVRLIDASDDSQIWGNQYVKSSADILAAQNEIAQAVAQNLRVRLTGTEQQQLAKRPTENVEAYQFYLRGRFHVFKLTPPEINQGISYFQQAIDLDPNYALAYAGLSDAYRSLGIGSEINPAENFPKAKAAASKAIEIDETLSEGYTALGATNFWLWDWNAAESNFKRALELNSNNVNAHMFYAHFLSNTGRHAEALAEIKQARELDPLFPFAGALEGQFLLHAGRTDEALTRLQKTFELAPNFWMPHAFISSVYIEKGMYDEAIAEARKANEFSPAQTWSIALEGYALAKSGKRDEARNLINKLMQLSNERFIPAVHIALIYNGLGETDKALEWLEKAYEQHDPKMAFLKVEPKWNNLRNEPRFIDLMRRMNFESVAVDAPNSAVKLYWQMPEAEQLALIKERAQHIQTLIGDEPTDFDEEALRAIKVEIDDYVEKKDSLSQKPFEEGLRVIYGRASQYAPVIIRAYEARQVSPALGLYQAMVETEYHDCLVSRIGSVGLFRFMPKTAAKYGLTPKDYCDVQKQSDAAAHYMSDLTSDFANGKSSVTLVLLGYVIGENGVRDYLRQLRERGVLERSFWTVFRHRQELKPPLNDEGTQYVPRFFAVAIIGETPEAFELSTPPLSTLREKDK